MLISCFQIVLHNFFVMQHISVLVSTIQESQRELALMKPVCDEAEKKS